VETADKKIYIGSTQKSLKDRFEEHARGKGSMWTSKRKCESITLLTCKTDSEQALFSELHETLKCMYERGYENVRGAMYTAEEIADFKLEGLKENLVHHLGLCYKCLQRGHFSWQCKNPRVNIKELKYQGISKVTQKNAITNYLK
jgi:predicted GIY-YIG superfamily endonuclease